MCGDFHSSMSTLKALLRSKDVLCLLQQITALHCRKAHFNTSPSECCQQTSANLAVESGVTPSPPTPAHPPPAFTLTYSSLPPPPVFPKSIAWERKNKIKNSQSSPSRRAHSCPPPKSTLLPREAGGPQSSLSPPPIQQTETKLRGGSPPPSLSPFQVADCCLRVIIPRVPIKNIKPHQLP